MAKDYFDLGIDFKEAGLKDESQMSVMEQPEELSGGFSQASDQQLNQISQYNETEQVIQDITNEQTPKETTYSEDEFFGDVDKIMEAEGIDFDTAYDETRDYYISKGYSVNGYKDEFAQPIQEEETPQEDIIEGGKEEKGFLQNFKEGTENVLGGAISSVPSIIGNTFGFLADVVTPKEYEGLGEVFRQQGITDKANLQEILGVEPEAFTTSAGEFGAEIGSLFIPGGQAKLIAKFPQASEKIAKLGNIIENIGEKSPKIYNTIKSAVIGAKEMGKFGIVDKGEVTKEDLVIGAGFGAGANILGGAIKGTFNYLRKELPEKLIVSGLVNPADLRNASERIAKLTGKEADVSDVSRWLLSKGVQGDKQAVRQGIKQGVESARNEVKALVKGNKEIYNNNIVTDLQNALTEKLGTFGKFTKTGFKPSAGNEGIVDDILEIATKPGMSVGEINKARSIIADDLFTKQGSMKEIATKKGWQNVWKNASQFLDETLPGFRNLNKEVEVGMALNTAIAKKEARDLTNQILSYMGFGTTGGAIAGISQGQDPMGVIKSALIGGALGIAGGKIKSKLNSTQFKTKLANMLSELSPAEKRAVLSGEGVITLGIVDKLKKGMGVAETNIKATGQKIKDQTLEKGGKLTDNLADKGIIKQ